MTAEDRARIEAGVCELYDAFASGDPDRYRSRFAGDLVWHVPSDNPVSGAYRGPHEYFETMTSKMAPLDEWTFQVCDVRSTSGLGQPWSSSRCTASAVESPLTSTAAT